MKPLIAAYQGKRLIPSGIKGLDRRTWYPSAYSAGLYDLRQGIADRLFNTHSYKEIFKIFKSESKAKKFHVKDILCYFIDLIISKIELYALPNTYKEAAGLNTQWNNFLESLSGEFEKIRIYTLNYDRLLVNILELKLKSKFFDGFKEKGDINFNEIWQDDNKFSYFNLHGSVHWEYDTSWRCDRKKICKSTKKYGKSVNEGRRDIFFNIITGLQKPFRMLEQPWYTFFQKFNIDCLNADTIMTVGYSYNDEHINKALGMAKSKRLRDVMKYLSQRKVTSVNNRLKSIKKELFGINGIHKQKTPTNGYIFEKNKEFDLTVYSEGFEEFLVGKQWEKSGFFS